MNYLVLKKAYECIPYVLKAPFANVLRGRLINDRVFIEQYKKLNAFDSYTKEQIEEEQFNLLRETLIHAYEHTVYYHDLFVRVSFDPYHIQKLSDIQRIPVLTKKDLQESFNKLAADDVSGSYVVTTGGTSGKPTKVLMSNYAFYAEWAFVYHFWSKFGYDYKKSRLATFRGVKLGKKLCEINPMYQEIRMNPFLMNRKNIKLYWKKMKSYGVDFIYGYPSVVFNFCKLAKSAEINLNGKFKAALLISENLYSFQEELINEVLGCPIGMFYGHSERAVFGEKHGAGYKFNQLYGVTEVSNTGRPIVTGFINSKMPLIRYEVDDQVSWTNGGYSIRGHHNGDVLYGKNGEEISGAAINFHDKTFESVEAYQFVQNTYGKCILCIIPGQKLNERHISQIQDRINKKFGAAFQVELRIVDKMQLTSRGKYQMIIQNIDSSRLGT